MGPQRLAAALTNLRSRMVKGLLSLTSLRCCQCPWSRCRMCWRRRRLRGLLVASRNVIRFTAQVVTASRHYVPGSALIRSSQTVCPAWSRAREQALGPAMKVASCSFRGWGNPRRLSWRSRPNHNYFSRIARRSYSSSARQLHVENRRTRTRLDRTIKATRRGWCGAYTLPERFR